MSALLPKNDNDDGRNMSQKEAEVLISGRAVPAPLEQRDYLINGKLEAWTGPFHSVHSPVRDGKGEPIYLGSYPVLTRNESLAALAAATAAHNLGQGEWPTMPVSERIAALERFTHAMIKRRERVIELLMWEIGKSLADSTKEFDRTVQYIRDTIDAVKQLDRASSRFLIEDGIVAQVRRAPFGVVLCMGPFNYPLNETFTLLIPALVMGNCVIMKPPKLGVLLHEPLLEAFRESFPPGVVNTVYGNGEEVVGPIIASGKVDVLAFIGSSKIANHLKRQHPRAHRLRCVLGLDAKNAGIVLPDADLDTAIPEILTGCLSFNGQRCTALKILFVHASRADEFVKRLGEAVDNLAVGLPWDKGVGITPLPEVGKPQRLKVLVDDAVSKGARVVNSGGAKITDSFFTPAVVFPVTSEMELYTQEQFGPVIPVVVYDTVETPIRYVVDSDYGQQVSIFGKDAKQIAQLIDPLVNQVCRVNLNSQCQRGPDSFPFTGRKDSAEGTLSVSDALRVFSIRTLVAAKQTELNKGILTEILRDRQSNFLSTDFIL
jgi:glyceraldehyde-3-phosphate dehydrogenase (NADP+)